MPACDFCGVFFRQKSNLMRHRRYHTGERKYKCSQCKLKFFRSDQLNDHRLYSFCAMQHRKSTVEVSSLPEKKVHFKGLSKIPPNEAKSDESSQFECRACEISFRNKELYSVHRSLHAEKHDFKCSRCRRIFDGPVTFNKHNCHRRR